MKKSIFIWLNMFGCLLYGIGVLMAGATLGYAAVNLEVTLPPNYWFNSIWNLTLTLIFYNNMCLLEKKEVL